MAIAIAMEIAMLPSIREQKIGKHFSRSKGIAELRHYDNVAIYTQTEAFRKEHSSLTSQIGNPTELINQWACPSGARQAYRSLANVLKLKKQRQ